MRFFQENGCLFFIFVVNSILPFCRAGGGGGAGYVPLKERLEHAPAPEIQSVYVPLIDHLKEHYVPIAMPICNQSDVLQVQVDMWLYQLYDLEEPIQALTNDVWIELNWHDCSLVWDPLQFNNITQFTLPAAEIWFPDIIMYQSLHGNFEEGLFVFGRSVARIRNTGAVQLGAQVILRSFCRVKIADFPFDVQYCNITFACWNKDSSNFRLVKHEEDAKGRGHSFKEASNGEWEVIGFPSFNSEGYYRVGVDESELKHITEVTFQLQLRRKPTYVMIYLVFPCVLLLWTSILTFYLPLESGEKISMAVTVLLSLFVFLLLVADNIPRSSDGIPILGTFYTICIVLVSISLLFTTIVVNVGLKTPEICIPRWIKRIMRLNMWRIVCFSYSDTEPNHRWISMKRRDKAPSSSTNDQGYTPARKSDKEDADEEDEVNLPPDVDASPVDRELTCSSGNCRKNDWRYFAMLLDRVFLIIYLILVIVATIYIYANSSRNSEVV